MESLTLIRKKTMIQYIGDIITIWALVFAILIMLVLCTFTIQWSLKRDTKNQKSEASQKKINEESRLLFA